MNFFETLHVFQRKASVLNLEPSDRLVYINLLIRANLDACETFDMIADDLALYTGLARNTVHKAKQRLKRKGFIEFDKYHITMVPIVDSKLVFGVQKKYPHTPKENRKNFSKRSESAGAREKETERPHTLSIIKAPEWY